MNRNTLFAACLLILTQQALSQITITDFCPDRTELGTGNGVKCASSWTYKGVTYNNVCTNVDHFRYWCSTKEGEFNIENWGNCLSKDCTPFCRTQTSLGTAQGARCNFPFNYQGRSFGSCTNLDHNTLWCATTPEYQGMWGNCMYDSACSFPYCADRTKEGTAFWDPCVIPFTYKGVEYDNCTTVDHNQPWCSTDAVFQGRWGNCMGQDCSNHCPERTAGGTDGGKACVFPFTYKGREYKSCTTFENFGRPWCSTTAVFNNLWGGCVYQKPCKNLCTDRTVRGTGGGAPCVFPFTYKGVSYTSCTSRDNRDILWCSTTPVYQGGYGACVYEC